jgi:hypothetical protein
VNATLRNAFLPVPMLLAGLQKGWMRFFDSGSVWSHAPEVAQVAQAAQVAEAPLAQKTLAGITMMVLALTGAAVPTVINDNKAAPKVQVAAAKAEDGPAVLRVLPTRPDPAMLGVVAVDSEKSASPAVESAAAAPAPDPAATPADSGPRNRLLPRFGRTPSDGSGREGDTRQRLLRPPGGDGSGSDGGILPGTPVGDAVTSTLGTVEDAGAAIGLDLAEAVPVGVGVTTPAPDADGTSSGVEAPLGVAVTVALPDVRVAGGIVDPVTGVLDPVAGRYGISLE